MSLSRAPQPWPIDNELPPELAFLANDISSYFSANAPYSKASLGALIFTPPPQPPALLLIQVSETTDPHAFSCAWEVPSGHPKSSDLTMLHALSRIILEQTGLHLSQIHTFSGSEIGPGTFESGNAEWMKLQFIVQVSEFETCTRTAFQPDDAYQSKNDELTGRTKFANTILVTLNHTKHQKHAWVTEKDLIEFIDSGLFPVDETRQYQSMLDAFSLCRQEAAQIQSGLVQSPTPSTAQSSSSDSSIALLANGYHQTGTLNSPEKANRRPSKRKVFKAGEVRANSSQFHRFRIS